jgi:hypothetical protein
MCPPAPSGPLCVAVLSRDIVSSSWERLAHMPRAAEVMLNNMTWLQHVRCVMKGKHKWRCKCAEVAGERVTAPHLQQYGVSPGQDTARKIVQLPAHAGRQHKAAGCSVIVSAQCWQGQGATLQPELLKQHKGVSRARWRPHQGLRTR